MKFVWRGKFLTHIFAIAGILLTDEDDLLRWDYGGNAGQAGFRLQAGTGKSGPVRCRRPMRQGLPDSCHPLDTCGTGTDGQSSLLISGSWEAVIIWSHN